MCILINGLVRICIYDLEHVVITVRIKPVTFRNNHAYGSVTRCEQSVPF